MQKNDRTHTEEEVSQEVSARDEQRYVPPLLEKTKKLAEVTGGTAGTGTLL